MWPHARVVDSSIGKNSNVQDNAQVLQSQIGNEVTLGHGAVLENCVVLGPALVAMNARLKNCTLKPWSGVGANAVVENQTLSSYQLWLGGKRGDQSLRSLLKTGENLEQNKEAIHERLRTQPAGRALFNFKEYVELGKKYQQVLKNFQFANNHMELFGYSLRKEQPLPYFDALLRHLQKGMDNQLQILSHHASAGVVILPYINEVYELVWPRIHPEARLAPGVCVFGDVVIGGGCKFETGVSLRGDYDKVRIGEDVYFDKHVTVHTNFHKPCVIEDGARVGRGAVIHACTLGQRARVGLYATLLDGCVIENNACVPDEMVVRYDQVIR